MHFPLVLRLFLACESRWRGGVVYRTLPPVAKQNHVFRIAVCFAAERHGVEFESASVERIVNPVPLDHQNVRTLGKFAHVRVDIIFRITRIELPDDPTDHQREPRKDCKDNSNYHPHYRVNETSEERRYGKKQCGLCGQKYIVHPSALEFAMQNFRAVRTMGAFLVAGTHSLLSRKGKAVIHRP